MYSPWLLKIISQSMFDRMSMLIGLIITMNSWWSLDNDNSY